MSKIIWLGMCVICLLLFLIFSTLYSKDKGEIKETETPIPTPKPKMWERLFVPETYAILKKFGIKESDNTIKAILISSYTICSVKPSFVDESLSNNYIKNEYFYVADREEFLSCIIKFNENFMKNVFELEGLKDILENKNVEYKDIIYFFDNFKEDKCKILGGENLMIFKRNKFYKRIKEGLIKNYEEDFNFIMKQNLKWYGKSYGIFDFVYLNFITVYSGFRPKPKYY
ncbi:hypothetical protein NGRA_2243 [Nosema granulosis]|uniref:Uncharacterized protein n=1 Tax=Nosema granulosis TaxID=83296 RepID=A0A9P6GY10_9MICR|nr:hypothetical protein NGRA_2243 [Nosema granulosis]